MNLREKVANLTFFSLLDTILGKAIHLISLIVLVKLLSRGDFGVIGISFGYLAILSFLSLAPETVLYRDFPNIKSDKKINLCISSFILFGLFRTLIILVISCAVGGCLYWYYKDYIIPLSFIIITLGSNIILLQGPIKELLRVDFRQKLATITGFFIEVAILFIIISALFLSPSLVVYLSVFLATSICALMVWLTILKRIYNFSWVFSRDTMKVLKHSIWDFSFWNHLNGSMTNLIYNVDTAILSLCGMSLIVIGNYTVALKLSNFFFVVPMILQGTNTIALSNVKKEKSSFTVSLFLKYILIISLIQLIIFILFGRWAIETFITPKDSELIFQHALLIIIGVSILNIVRPLISWVAIKGSLKQVFFKVYLPSGIISFFIYLILTKYFGSIGTAFGNIVCYLLFSVLMIYYIAKKCSFKIEGGLITRDEKDLLLKLFKTMSSKRLKR